MNIRIPWLPVLIVVALSMAACGDSTTPVEEATGTTSGSTVPTGPPDGEEIYSRALLDGRPGCITCHSLEPGVELVGPSMAGVVARAEAASPDDPAAYIRKSIAVPDAEVLEGYVAGSMPQSELTDAELDALVAYLLEVGG